MYGWFCKEKEQVAGYAIYLDSNNKEVKVTHIYNDPHQGDELYGEIKYVGVVTVFVRYVSTNNTVESKKHMSELINITHTLTRRKSKIDID